MGFRVWGLGFGVWGLRFGVWGLGSGVGVLTSRRYWNLFRPTRQVSGERFSRACAHWILPQIGNSWIMCIIHLQLNMSSVRSVSVIDCYWEVPEAHMIPRFSFAVPPAWSTSGMRPYFQPPKPWTLSPTSLNHFSNSV